MKISIALLLVIMFAVVSGCSVHPLPEDTTRDTTLAIVRKIRCEARDALQEISIQRIRAAKKNELADRIASGELRVEDIFLRQSLFDQLPESIKRLFYYFTLTGVGFDFRFNITSVLDNNVDSNFGLPFSSGSFGLNLKAGKKLERQNERKFLMSSSFYDLHNERRLLEPDGRPLDCNSISAVRGNIIYPITGRIGLEEVFNTYIDLKRQVGLAMDAGGDGYNAFSDKLTFTTKLSATAGPKITLSPVSGNHFRLADVGATIEAERTDVHEVTINVESAGEFGRKELFARSGIPLSQFSDEKVSRNASAARRAAEKAATFRRTEQLLLLPLENERRLDALE